MTRPWPLNIPHRPTPEEEAEYEAIIAKIESGNFKTRPLSPEETLWMKRLQSSPVSISIERFTEDTFHITMNCYGCEAKEEFDHTAPQPWIDYRSRFNEAHKNHERKPRGRKCQ